MQKKGNVKKKTAASVKDDTVAPGNNSNLEGQTKKKLREKEDEEGGKREPFGLAKGVQLKVKTRAILRKKKKKENPDKRKPTPGKSTRAVPRHKRTVKGPVSKDSGKAGQRTRQENSPPGKRNVYQTIPHTGSNGRAGRSSRAGEQKLEGNKSQNKRKWCCRIRPQ